jgi:hypothetical protein
LPTDNFIFEQIPRLFIHIIIIIIMDWAICGPFRPLEENAYLSFLIVGVLYLLVRIFSVHLESSCSYVELYAFQISAAERDE